MKNKKLFSLALAGLVQSVSAVEVPYSTPTHEQTHVTSLQQFRRLVEECGSESKWQEREGLGLFAPLDHAAPFSRLEAFLKEKNLSGDDSWLGMGSPLIYSLFKRKTSGVFAKHLPHLILDIALENNIELNHRCPRGRSALTYLAAFPEVDIDITEKLLRTKNIEVDLRSYRRQATPLMVALEHGNTKVALALIKAGANVKAADFVKGRNPNSVEDYFMCAVAQQVIKPKDFLDEARRAGLEGTPQWEAFLALKMVRSFIGNENEIAEFERLSAGGGGGGGGSYPAHGTPTYFASMLPSPFSPNAFPQTGVPVHTEGDGAVLGLSYSFSTPRVDHSASDLMPSPYTKLLTHTGATRKGDDGAALSEAMLFPGSFDFKLSRGLDAFGPTSGGWMPIDPPLKELNGEGKKEEEDDGPQ